ncbi:MAG TPA: hypothetical protein VG649_13475 [Candidatus Angelobacter sp.]|jgi:hypothetical protein|nr:hypothetical protein [Candidatus Angelobacter sp.]
MPKASSGAWREAPARSWLEGCITIVDKSMVRPIQHENGASVRRMNGDYRMETADEGKIGWGVREEDWGDGRLVCVPGRESSRGRPERLSKEFPSDFNRGKH